MMEAPTTLTKTNLKITQIMRGETYIYALNEHDIIYRLPIQEWLDMTTIGTVGIWERASVWERRPK